MRGGKRVLAAAAAGAMSAGALVGVGASTAAAAPSNAPTAVAGTFDCGSAGTGTFVVNSGNASAPATWNVAHLMFASGGTGIFVPDMFDLTFTIGSQTFTQQVSKPGAGGSALCDISAAAGPFSLSGQVGGKIVMTG